MIVDNDSCNARSSYDFQIFFFKDILLSRRSYFRPETFMFDINTAINRYLTTDAIFNRNICVHLKGSLPWLLPWCLNVRSEVWYEEGTLTHRREHAINMIYLEHCMLNKSSSLKNTPFCDRQVAAMFSLEAVNKPWTMDWMLLTMTTSDVMLTLLRIKE